MRQLARTGVTVSPLCLGAMSFGAWGNPDHDESIGVVHRALGGEVDFIDTADDYSGGESGRTAAKTPAGDRQNPVLGPTARRRPA